MALFTLANYKTYAGISDSSGDVKLQALVDFINTFVLRYLNRNIISATYTDEEYDGTGLVELKLKNFPITEVTEVNLNGEILDPVDFDDRLSGVRGYWISNADSGIISNLWMWPRGRANIKITYKGGYAITPSDLLLACYKVVDYYDAIAKRKIGVLSENLGSYSYSLAVGYNAPEGFWYIPNESRIIFDSYRDLGIENGVF